MTERKPADETSGNASSPALVIMIGRAVSLLILALGAGGIFSQLGLPPREQVACTITCVAAVMWMTEAVPLYLTSLLVLFLSLIWLKPTLEASGETISAEQLTSPFFSNIILLFLGGFVLAAGLKRQQLDTYCAARLLKWGRGSVPRLLLVTMSVTAFLSMWLSNTASAAMMLALVLPLVHQLPDESPGRNALLLSIPFSANIGGLGTPIGSPPNAIALEYLREASVAPSFAVWMLIGIPGVVGMILFSWGLLMLMFRVRHHRLEPRADESSFRWDAGTMLVGITTLLTVAGWLSSDWHGYSSGTVALIPVLVFFGTGLLKTVDLKQLSWDVLLLMGGGLCLGVVISESGFAARVVSWLPVENLTVYTGMVLFGIAACSLSSIMSNTATANLILPIALGLQLEPLRPLMVGIAFACTLAMPLPISTPPNALVFSSGEVRLADLQKSGAIITVVGVLLAFTTGWWWWKLWGLF